jgi:pyruvate/2-oxoglutarate dehydrogenase complex dihydrolipoamide dehydrogenase (E3) component
MQYHQSPANGLPDGQDNHDLLMSVHPSAWQNPQPKGIYNLVVIGGGPAGITAARHAACLGAKVALIERNLLGGTSLNVGCIPSKAIIRTSRLYGELGEAEDFGADVPRHIDIDFSAAMERMRRIRARIGRYNSVERLKDEGVDVFFGAARFVDPRTVEIGGKTLQFKKALIATGVRPLVPPIPGLVEAGYLNNENFFNLTQCPPRLLVIGGGPLGCEIAQALCRLGSHVIIAHNEPMFLPGEERDAAQLLSDALARDGVEIHLNTAVVAVRTEGGQKIADLVTDNYKFSVSVDEIAAGVGRSPNVEGMDLEVAGVRYDTVTGIFVNDFLQSTNRKIYAAGDVCLERKFAHVAEASARIVVRNALFMGRQRLSKLVIPWSTYTDPEIAHVGLYVWEAQSRNIPVKTFTILMHDVDRAITDGEEEGFVKIHLREGTDEILGATVVARHAGEMITGLSLAITSGIGLREMARVIHAYPTQVGAIKMAAVAYNRSRISPFLKALSKRWLAL